MSYRRFLILPAIFLLTVVASALAQPADLNDLSVANALGGPPILDAIRSATTVTAQRIDSQVAETRETAEPHPKITPLAEPFTVPAAEADALKKVFTASSTYLSPSKTCEFRANVRYSFIKSPEHKVEFILCFGCGELEVRENEKLVSFGPFDGGYGEILAITKRLFPNDEFLAKFNEETFKERAARMQVTKP